MESRIENEEGADPGAASSRRAQERRERKRERERERKRKRSGERGHLGRVVSRAYTQSRRGLVFTSKFPPEVTGCLFLIFRSTVLIIKGARFL